MADGTATTARNIHSKLFILDFCILFVKCNSYPLKRGHLKNLKSGRDSKLGIIETASKSKNISKGIVYSGEIIKKITCMGIASQSINNKVFSLYSKNNPLTSRRNNIEIMR